MKIFDISRPLDNTLAPWPGDTAFHFDLKWKMTEGATVNVGAVTMGVHNGTHADAPFHFQQGANAIEQMPLEIYLGDAVVVDLSQKFETDRKGPIAIADIAPHVDAFGWAPRVLLKTSVWKDSTVFPDWIPVIAPDVAGWLGTQNVKLLGLDLPSVDTIEAKILVNHHALAAAGIVIVESLNLTKVEPGSYHFSALPLRVSGGDAAPVRAILWRD
ncbi:MAG TPA: cyclase family protein [Chthoniobacterales bacterium]|nr:cyclase family protein [Chthoniobacterales bacterium]